MILWGKLCNELRCIYSFQILDSFFSGTFSIDLISVWKEARQTNKKINRIMKCCWLLSKLTHHLGRSLILMLVMVSRRLSTSYIQTETDILRKQMVFNLTFHISLFDYLIPLGLRWRWPTIKKRKIIQLPLENILYRYECVWMCMNAYNISIIFFYLLFYAA